MEKQTSENSKGRVVQNHTHQISTILTSDGRYSVIVHGENFDGLISSVRIASYEDFKSADSFVQGLKLELGWYPV